MATRIIPIKDFYRNSEKTYFTISLDGTRVAFLAPHNSRLNIMVLTLATGEEQRITNESERDIHSYSWVANNRIVYSKDFGGNENFSLVAVNTDGGEPLWLTPNESWRVSIIDRLRDDEEHILIGINDRDSRYFDVKKLNVFTGESTLVAENPGGIVGWNTDNQGNIRGGIKLEGTVKSLLHRSSTEQEFTELFSFSHKDSFEPMFFHSDGNRFYALSNINRNTKALVLYNPETLQEEVIYENQEYDCTAMSYSRKRDVLRAAYYESWKTEIVPFDAVFDTLYKNVTLLLPPGEISVIDADKNEEHYIICVYSDRIPVSYYYYNLAENTVQHLANAKPWLHPDDLAEMKPISYTSRDGLTIHGYLTIPNGSDGKNLPVVINPHGGPWVRDSWGYVSDVQFLANRGYAVLRINYRGSTGYGKIFYESSFKQWGLKMQDDISDGVQWLIDQGIADPKRVAIYGGSYGGYATLAGLTFTPHLYCCGIDFVGVSNLFTFLQSIPDYWKPLLESTYEMVGHPERDAEQFKATSPVFHVDKIIAPLLVAQGAKDPRVNINESDQIVNELRNRGVDVEYIVKENEGHGFYNEENKFEFYERMEIFLEKHCKNNR